MQKRCSKRFSDPALGSQGQKSNTRCSWSGTRPIGSVPNASCLFSRHSSKRWSGMSISKSRRSADRRVPDPAAVFHTLYPEQERRKRVLGWRRTHKDPFAGEWELIIFWVLSNPERSSGDIFRELQRRSPGRYQPLQIRTLQRGMRKIRAYLLETLEEQWQEEMIHGPSPAPISSAKRAAGISSTAKSE